MTKRTTSLLLGGVAALALLGSACSNEGGVQAAAPAADTPAAASETTVAATPSVAAPSALLSRSPIGDLLVGPEGLTLYGFTNDTAAASTCYDACAEAWPPVLVDRDWGVGPNLDLGIFATTVRDDGSLQLVAGKWPLYYYVGDEAIGDLNGQGSGDVWFAVDPDGILITDESAATATAGGDDAGGDSAAATTNPVTIGDTELGQVLTDDQGLTLYGFTQDVDGLPSCDDGCAEAWPPVLVDSLPDGLDPEVFSVATRNDGTTQLVAGVWPLYRFAGDGAAGEVNGQGSGDVWFAVSPDGGLIGRDGDAAATTEEGY